MQMDFTRLRLLRKARSMTQEEVAERLGVSRQAVAKWERGESMPDLYSAVALADLFEITVDALARNLTCPADAPLGPDREGRYIFGISRLNDRGQVTLPAAARRVFALETGDSLLILGDEQRGIALLKVSGDGDIDLPAGREEIPARPLEEPLKEPLEEPLEKPVVRTSAEPREKPVGEAFKEPHREPLREPHKKAPGQNRTPGAEKEGTE